MKVNNPVSSSIWSQEKNTTFRFGARHAEMDKLQIWNQVYYRTKSSYHQNHRQMLDSSHVIQMKLKSASKDLPKGILLVLISCGKMELEKLDTNIYKSMMKERFEIKLDSPKNTRTVRTTCLRIFRPSWTVRTETNRRDPKISRTAGVCVSKRPQTLNPAYVINSPFDHGWPDWPIPKPFYIFLKGVPLLIGLESFQRPRILRLGPDRNSTKTEIEQNSTRSNKWFRTKWSLDLWYQTLFELKGARSSTSSSFPKPQFYQSYKERNSSVRILSKYTNYWMFSILELTLWNAGIKTVRYSVQFGTKVKIISICGFDRSIG